MHIAPQILPCLYSAGWHAGVLQEPHGLVWRMLPGPDADESIQGVVLWPAISRRRKARIVRQGRLTNEPGEGTPVRIGGTAHDAPGIMPPRDSSPAGHCWGRDCR